MTKTDTDLSKSVNHEFSDLENERASIRILLEAARLQAKKSRDYQNPNSSLTQADYYPRGLWTILDTIHGKRLRAVSVLEAMENDPDYGVNFESLEDTFIDIINYASFAVAWCRGEMTGQDLESTGLTSNKPIKKPVGTKGSAEQNRMEKYVEEIDRIASAGNVPCDKLAKGVEYAGDLLIADALCIDEFRIFEENGQDSAPFTAFTVEADYRAGNGPVEIEVLRRQLIDAINKE